MCLASVVSNPTKHKKSSISLKSVGNGAATMPPRMWFLVCSLLIAVADCAPILRGSFDWQEQNHRLNARPPKDASEETPPQEIENGDPVLRFKNMTLDFEEAKMYARMSTISYCDRDSIRAWNCSMCQLTKIKDFVLWDVFFSVKWDASAYIGYFPKNNTKVIAFRGTDSSSLWNWIENLKAYRSSLPLNVPGMNGAYVHTGFYKMWNDSNLKRNLTIAMADMLSARGWEGPLVVTGHSLGGAMASMCSTYMKYTFSLAEVREYTYGSPRVGNQAFVDAYKRMVYPHWRFTHQYDIVPSVPFVWFGYHHVPVEIWQVDTQANETAPMHTTYKVCDGGGEDPDCHLGACFLGFCRGIADHMHYLHIPMYCDS
ncbi:hypothetical protein BSKO_03806 [Bryopsis sp. KO-2023]|nr:hypothetical protein BSKO_03806 [Bryopsis sp. KO-2023]